LAGSQPAHVPTGGKFRRPAELEGERDSHGRFPGTGDGGERRGLLAQEPGPGERRIRCFDVLGGHDEVGLGGEPAQRVTAKPRSTDRLSVMNLFGVDVVVGGLRFRSIAVRGAS